jgi:hypothetical protein
MNLSGLIAALLPVFFVLALGPIGTPTKRARKTRDPVRPYAVNIGYTRLRLTRSSADFGSYCRGGRGAGRLIDQSGRCGQA